MPVYDQKHKIVFGDPKPKRVCNYMQCPNNGKYKGLQVKICSQCKWVRYCSEECQAADWPEHKSVCREPVCVDIGSWLEQHARLFRWAVFEALGCDGVNLTPTHALFVDLIRTDRLVTPTPLSFLVKDLYPVPHGLAEKHWRFPETFQFLDEKDIARSKELRRQGGLGVAVIIFNIGGPNGTSMFRFLKFDFGRKEPRAMRPSMEGWREKVKAIANCETDEDLPASVPTKFPPPLGL